MKVPPIPMTVAAGRAAFGVLLISSPRTGAGSWIGGAIDQPGARLLVRSIGARDIAIGLGGVLALARGQDASPWLIAGVVSDVADSIGTLAAYHHLPSPGRNVTLAITIGATLAGLLATARAAR